MICPNLGRSLEEFTLKKQEVPTAALLRPAPRKIRIRCSNQPRWNGITLSNDKHTVHRLGKNHFAGLACDSVLTSIFPNGDDVIRVELTDDGALIQAEGMPRISVAHAKKHSSSPFLAPYDRRTMATFEGFSLRIESA